jgi:TetR/AcrR family transcriptional repressor of nem operon
MRLTAKDKILEAALRLLLSRGYAATTVDEICEAAGVSKGSFYHFFGTKEELGLAVLDQFSARNARLVDEGPYRDAADPMKRALELVDHLIATASEMWGSGCLLGTFALDLAETNPTIRKAVAEKFEGVAEGLADGMAPLATQGQDPAGLSPRDLAEHFIVVVEGALILAKAHQDWSYVDRALERFRNDVRRAAPVTSNA